MDQPDDALVAEALRVIQNADPEEVSRALTQLSERLGAAVGHTSGATSLTVTKGEKTVVYGLADFSAVATVDALGELVHSEATKKDDITVEFALLVLILVLASGRIGQILAESHRGSDVTAAIIAALAGLVAALRAAKDH